MNIQIEEKEVVEALEIYLALKGYKSDEYIIDATEGTITVDYLDVERLGVTKDTYLKRLEAKEF